MSLLDVDTLLAQHRDNLVHLDLAGDELRQNNRYISNLEVAFVKLDSTSKMLHGRLIEESNIVGGRLKDLETGVLGLDDRLGIAEQGMKALERRLADADPPSSMKTP